MLICAIGWVSACTCVVASAPMLSSDFYLVVDNVELAALVTLPALLPDSRCKVDISKIIYMAKVNK